MNCLFSEGVLRGLFSGAVTHREPSRRSSHNENEPLQDNQALEMNVLPSTIVTVAATTTPSPPVDKVSNKVS